MLVYKKGYARKVSTIVGLSLNTIQKQFIKFEKAGIFVSFLEGRTRIFEWNPRYPFRNELLNLIQKAYDYLPESDKEKYFKYRTRPRRTGKPL
ncbi:ArsR family transcriptional regulator [bacterium]|nr:ArsR family transcriptional regulator [bacterium]